VSVGVPFTSLLLTGLASNRLVKEQDVSVAIRQDNNKQDNKDDEIFLLFSSDKCDAFHKVFLKNIQKAENEPSCCDAICFYAQSIKNQKPKIIICFIELKAGKDIDKAVSQISNTYEGVKKGIEEIHEINTQKLKITWKALIVTKSSLENNYIHLLDDLKRKKVDVRCICSSNTINLTDFIKENKIVVL